MGMMERASDGAEPRSALFIVIAPLLHHSNTPFFSVRAHAHYLKETFQFGVTEKGDLERAFALVVTQMHLRAQALAHAVLDAGQMRIGGRRGRPKTPGSRAIFPSLPASHQRLGLAHIQALLKDAFGGKLLLLLTCQPKDHF